MTIRKYFEDRLIANGLFPPEAAEVMKRAEASSGNESMAGRWGEDKDDYEEMLLRLMWAGVCHVTLEWIDATRPKAWYRQMFEDEAWRKESK